MQKEDFEAQNVTISSTEHDRYKLIALEVMIKRQGTMYWM